MGSAHTQPQVFIIESLSIQNEIDNRYDGKIVRDILRISGLQPAYYYVRTKREFKEAVSLFVKSKYRYLHLSMHGYENGLELTAERLSNDALSKILKDKLKNRRLFLSACRVGSGFLPNLLQTNNRGAYSILSALDDIPFSTSCALWCSLYPKLFSERMDSIKCNQLVQNLNELTRFFGLRFRLSIYRAERKEWEEVQLPTS